MLNIQIAMWFHLLFDTISNILSLPATLMFFASDFNFLSQRLQFPLGQSDTILFCLPFVFKPCESMILHPNLQNHSCPRYTIKTCLR